MANNPNHIGDRGRGIFSRVSLKAQILEKMHLDATLLFFPGSRSESGVFLIDSDLALTRIEEQLRVRKKGSRSDFHL